MAGTQVRSIAPNGEAMLPAGTDFDSTRLAPRNLVSRTGSRATASFYRVSVLAGSDTIRAHSQRCLFASPVPNGQGGVLSRIFHNALAIQRSPGMFE